MARIKVTESPKPEAPPPVTLLRVEERTERVDLDDAKKVERMAVAVGMLHTADALFDEAAELADEAKNKKKSAEAKREEGKKVLFDAQNGQALQPYPVIVERHPVRPVEMMVWRVADGMTASELLELDPTEQPRTEEEHIAARESQGCTLVESRAMTPDELAVAQAEDHARANPPLPMDGLEAPADGAASAADGGGEDDEAGEDDDEAGGDEDDDEDVEASGDDSAAEAAPAPARKHKPANPNVIARVRIALNGLSGGAAYSMPELAEKTDHHPDDIKPAIEQLIEEGFAVKTGKARGTRYGRALATTEAPVTSDDAPAEL